MAKAALTYVLRLTEPLLAGRTGGDANTALSYDYVPGSLVRGAVLSRLGYRNPDGVKLLTPEVATFLNAYPARHIRGAWKRTLPFPLNWRLD